MAKVKAPETPATSTAPATNGAPAAAAETTAKPKVEKLFGGGNSRAAEMRRRESEVNTKFNRIGRKLKALGISKESLSAIVDILKKDYDATLQAALAEPFEAEVDDSIESFV